jgi:hypothetical protein
MRLELRRKLLVSDLLTTGALVGVVRIYILIGMLNLALSSRRPAKVGNDVRGRADAGIHS